MPELSFDSLTEGIPLLTLLKPPLTMVATSACSSESLRDLKLDSLPFLPLELAKSI